MLPKVKEIGDKFKKEKAEEFNIGDTVRVSQKITEGDKERIQVFEGVVIARKGGGVSETFTVRKVVQGIGVEKIFPIHSPKVDKIKVMKSGRVRRAKLYYLRDRVGKATKIQDKAFQQATPAAE